MWLDGEFLRWALKKPIVALSSAGAIGCAATDPSGERGAINLRGCAVADDAAEARRGNAFVFDVQILAGHNPKAPGLCFCLQASSEEERALWKAAIAHAASRGPGAQYY